MAEQRKGKMTGYDADGNPVYTICEICKAEGSIVFHRTKTGVRCLSCYSKYGDQWTPLGVELEGY